MHHDFLIIGGGIVGLATAYKLKLKYPDKNVIVIEKEAEIALHQTGNNNGVLHSGIYYKPNSLKAKNCLSGYAQMLDFCKNHKVSYEICGKIIVATEESELPALEMIYKRGLENGLLGLKYLNPIESRKIEPNVHALKSIFVPQTGIIDFKEVSLKLKKLFESLGGKIYFQNKVIKINRKGNHFKVITNKMLYETKFVINCAGLYSDKIAKMMGYKTSFQIIPFRGEYYILKSKKKLVNHLIYPVPNPDFPFLGVHFTRMRKGGVECGPNAVLAMAREGYTWKKWNLIELIEILRFEGFHKVVKKHWRDGLVEMSRSLSKSKFTQSLRKLIPEIKKDDLIKASSGVRAQAVGIDGKLIDDFLFIEDRNVIHVCNAPSPAATSCLSIADEIIKRVLNHYRG